MKKDADRAFVACVSCGYVSNNGYETHCPKDKNLLSVRVPDLRERHCNVGPFAERFSDILPDFSLSAYRETEPLTSSLITVPGTELGMDVGIVALKNECELPTGTTKARMAAAALGFLKSRDVETFIVCSTGNSTSAMARLLKEYPEMRMIAYCGSDFAERHETFNLQNVELRLVSGDFVMAEAAARKCSMESGVAWEGGFFNPARRIGLATAYLEVCEEVHRAPDWYVQAVSSGMGLIGVAEMIDAQLANGRIAHRPRLLGVQQDSCAPMVFAFEKGDTAIAAENRIQNPTGIAKAILRGDPTASYPIVRKRLLESSGGMIAVTEMEILHAQEKLWKTLAISAGTSAAAALAGTIKMSESGRIGSNEFVLVNLTGTT